MNRTRLNKLDSAELSRLLPRLELPPEVAAQVASCAQVSEAVEHLAQQDCLIEAARLCAYALPAREAVWWAIRCAAVTAPAGLPEADREACALAEAWVRKPADTTRRQAMERAQVAGFTTAEAWAAVAAFWSGDSMSPPDQPKVPPAPHLTGTAVAGAMILASVRPGADRQQERLSRFLGSARDIALGGSGYLDPEPN
jgi:hypothetical protein